MNNEIIVSGPVTTGITSLMQIVCDHFGMQHVSGEYMCWDARGFHMWVEGNDLPVHVVTRVFAFDDYPGGSEPDKEGRQVHVIGRYGERTNSINAVKYWFDGDAVPA